MGGVKLKGWLMVQIECETHDLDIINSRLLHLAIKG